MKVAYMSPLTIAQKQIEYSKHLRRIDRIQRQRHRDYSLGDIGATGTNHKMKSANVKRHHDQIQQQNEKLLARLLDISQRKSLSFSNKLEYLPSTPSVNPYRKKLMRQILNENQQLAERLISKQSEFNPNKIQKEIQEYERIKRSMLRNKRINLPIIHRTIFQ